jgi:condensin complex subunit 1
MTLHGKELKGMWSRFFKCYRMLYFDLLPDMEHRQQVNRVTKILIEYVQLSFSDLGLLEHLQMIDV